MSTIDNAKGMASGQKKLLGERTIAYIDGFNLYFGMCDANLRHCLWLNVDALAKKITRTHQVVGVTKYFSARISGGKKHDSDKRKEEKNKKRQRQSRYLSALESLPSVQMFMGSFNDEPISCRACSHTWDSHEEKMTDVNIATEMLSDAFTDEADTFLLVSGDSDLVPPIKKIKQLFPSKKIIVAFPPERESYELSQVADARKHLSASFLGSCQLKHEIILNSGYKLKRPEEWKT